MKNAPGYPLPSGDLGSDDIVCQLVYLPDRPEYWQAFYAALHYMTTWRAWERDNDKRGKDAAANWRAAFEMTSECWRMSCLEQLQDDVAAILAIMQIPQACCDAGDVTDGDQYTDRVEDGVGDVPQNVIDAGYADDAADWDGFADYKCMIAHVMIDQLEARLNEIAPLVDAAGGILGGVAALAGILAIIFGTAGLAIVFGIVAGIGATSLLYKSIMDFGVVEGLANKVATNHQELMCSIYWADGDVGSLVALNDKIDELFTTPEALILKNMNLGPTLKALYAGRYDQQDIADILLDAGYVLGNFDCDCFQIGEFSLYTDWETGGNEGWTPENGGIAEGNGVGGGWGFAGAWTNSPRIYINSTVLITEAGLTPEVGDIITVNRVRFSYKFSEDFSQQITLRVDEVGDHTDWEFYYSGTHTVEQVILDPPLSTVHVKGAVVRFELFVGSFGIGYVDNVTIDYDVTKI